MIPRATNLHVFTPAELKRASDGRNAISLAFAIALILTFAVVLGAH